MLDMACWLWFQYFNSGHRETTIFLHGGCLCSLPVHCVWKVQYTVFCTIMCHALIIITLLHKFAGVLVCITDSTSLLVFLTALQYLLPVYANITPSSHLYIWKPFVFVYLSHNSLCQRRTLTFQIHPSDPTAAGTSVERSVTDNTLSDIWVMYKLQRATDLCRETKTEGEC